MNSINLVLSSGRMGKRLLQTKFYKKYFLLCLKRDVSSTFESSCCKKHFPKCVCYWYNLLRWMSFFYSMWLLDDIIFYENLSLPRGFWQPPCCCILWKNSFERSSGVIELVYWVQLHRHRAKKCLFICM